MIEVREVTKNFGAVTALDGLSFVVRPGRVTGFLGPNGAGKATTMRVVLGLDRPTTGTALVGDRPYRHVTWPPRPPWLALAGVVLGGPHRLARCPARGSRHRDRATGRLRWRNYAIIIMDYYSRCR